MNQNDIAYIAGLFDSKGSISYRKKVLPSIEKIISIGEFINKRDIKSLTTTQYKEAIFFPIFFNNAFKRIQKPYKKFEVLK